MRPPRSPSGGPADASIAARQARGRLACLQGSRRAGSSRPAAIILAFRTGNSTRCLGMSWRSARPSASCSPAASWATSDRRHDPARASIRAIDKGRRSACACRIVDACLALRPARTVRSHVGVSLAGRAGRTLPAPASTLPTYHGLLVAATHHRRDARQAGSAAPLLAGSRSRLPDPGPRHLLPAATLHASTARRAWAIGREADLVKAIRQRHAAGRAACWRPIMPYSNYGRLTERMPPRSPPISRASNPSAGRRAATVMLRRRCRRRTAPRAPPPHLVHVAKSSAPRQ